MKKQIAVMGGATLVFAVQWLQPQALFSKSAIANAQPQSTGSCYWVNSSGRTIDLSRLCSQSPPQDTGLFRAKIKRRLGGIPVIDVTFNGKKNFEMIVDTGASKTLITLAMAQALRIQPTGTVRSNIADGRQVDFLVGILPSLAVQGAVVQNVQVAIAPNSNLSIGLLGHEFFEGYDVSINRQYVEFRRR
jgi:predicted aspartyl protease